VGAGEWDTAGACAAVEAGDLSAWEEGAWAGAAAAAAEKLPE